MNKMASNISGGHQYTGDNSVDHESDHEDARKMFEQQMMMATGSKFGDEGAL